MPGSLTVTPRAGLAAADVDDHVAAARRELERVLEDVADGLGEAVGVAAHRQRPGRDAELDAVPAVGVDALAQKECSLIDRLLDHRDQVDGGQVELEPVAGLEARGVGEPVDEARHPVALPDHPVEGLDRGAGPPARQLEVVEERGERRALLVREQGQEGPARQLGGAVILHVDARAHEAGEAAVGAVDRHAAVAHPAVDAVVAAHAVLGLERRPAREVVAVDAEARLDVVGVHARGPAVAELVGERAPGEREPRRVEIIAAAVDAGTP